MYQAIVAMKIQQGLLEKGSLYVSFTYEYKCTNILEEESTNMPHQAVYKKHNILWESWAYVKYSRIFNIPWSNNIKGKLIWLFQQM